jgi:aspartate/methionine/tyrosine aminotransferase
MRDGHNGYVPSAGIPEAREAVAADYTARGIAVSPDRVLITTGTSEGIELALNALVDDGDEVLVPSPTYPLYTAVLAKISAQPRYYRTDPEHDWLPDLDHLRTLVTSETRVLVVIDPNNPTGAVYPAPVRRALIDFAERHDLTILADEVYGDVAYSGPLPLMGTFDLDAPIISFLELVEGVSGAGWRAGWLVAGRTPRLDDTRRRDEETGRRPIVQPGSDAVRRRRRADRRSLTPGLVPRSARRACAHHHRTLERDSRHALCAPARGVLRAAAQISLPPGRTDEHFVLSLLRETGILCVNGSGFGVPASDGFFRIVFLANPRDLEEIYADIAAFTREYLARG